MALIFAFMPVTSVEAREENIRTNLICFWIEDIKLKAVTLMNFDSGTGRVGILSVPLYTNVEVKGQLTTIEELWKREGRKGITNRLETLLEININGQITFDQPVLEKASLLIGSFPLKGTSMTMVQAFDETRLERRKDDEAILRAMATNIISPSELHKVPQLLWLFTTQVDSNISPDLMMRIYGVVSHQGTTILTKKSLKGKDYYHGGYRYRYVEPATWKNIINEISA